MPWLKKKYILPNNLGRKQSFNEILPVFIILQKKKKYQKILQKLQPENQFHTFLCVCKELSTISVGNSNF